jgi:hypothetical protein
VSEKTLWGYLRGLVPIGKYTRIETGETGPGVPDVYYRLQAKKNGWMELKDSRTPNAEIPFKTEDDGLHTTQLDWIRDEVRMGGTVWIVARAGTLVYWVPGRLAPRFNGNPNLRRISSWVLNGRTIRTEDTSAIRRMLCGELQ